MFGYYSCVTNLYYAILWMQCWKRIMQWELSLPRNVLQALYIYWIGIRKICSNKTVSWNSSLLLQWWPEMINRLSANTKRVVVIGGRNPLVDTHRIVSLLCTNRLVRKCFSHLVETLNLSGIVGIFQWHKLVENHNYQSQICKEGWNCH